MTSNPTPKYIQPLRWSERGKELTGRLPLVDFSRLAPLLTHQQGEVTFTLQFGTDNERFAYLQGTLDCCLPLECQRCLETIDYPLQLTISLSPVFNEAASKKLPSHYEPLLLVEDQVLLTELLEEELLLGLPPIPKHDDPPCVGKGSAGNL